MIFSFDKNDKGFDSIFNNKLDSDTQWSSSIPNPVIFDAINFDPALAKDLYGRGSNGLSYLGSLYLQNNITSVRNTIGAVASTLGYLTTEFPNITKIFTGKASEITLTISTINNISKMGIDYQTGLNAIGAIPVVGWIIGIIVKVAELVVNIVKAIQNNNESDATQKLIGQFSIPIAQFNKDADEGLTRICMNSIRQGDMNYLFSPRYKYEDFEDFCVSREKNENDPEPYNLLTRAFNITSKKGDGIGFIPGTIDIFSAIRLITSKPGFGSGSTRNIGEFYPTVRNLCVSIYEMIQKPSPALFSITPSKLATDWEDTIYNMLVYSELSLIKGWSGFQTGIIDSDKFLCAKPVYGQLDCKKSKADKNITIPKTTDPFGHFNSFRDDIFDKFFAGKFKEKKLINDIKQLTNPVKNIDMKQSTPSLALKNIKETQYAVINSLNCCYVDDQRFAAIKKDGDPVLNKKWLTNVSAVLNSNEWKKLRFLDIPDGEFKTEVFNKAKKAGFKDFDNRKGTIENKIGSIKAGPSILGDPEPPKPFQIVQVSNNLQFKKPTTSKSENSLITMMAAAAVGGFLILKK